MNFNKKIKNCLIKKSISVPKKIVHTYISYTIGPHLGNLKTDFTLDNC